MRVVTARIDHGSVEQKMAGNDEGDGQGPEQVEVRGCGIHGKGTPF